MAHAFARHGAKLMLLDIDTAALEQTRAQLREAFPGVEVHIVPASIADDVAVEQACAATEARFGRIDLLLNNAGISKNKPSLELTPAEWRRALDLALSRSEQPTPALQPIMRIYYAVFCLNKHKH